MLITKKETIYFRLGLKSKYPCDDIDSTPISSILRENFDQPYDKFNNTMKCTAEAARTETISRQQISDDVYFL